MRGNTGEAQNARGPVPSDPPGPPPDPAGLSDVARQLRWFLWHFPERREASADELRREMWGYPRSTGR